MIKNDVKIINRKMLSTKKSIAIIILYFGEFDWYFNYFIHSCKYNPDVHFFIITDNKTGIKKPQKNIFFIHKTFEQIKTIIRERLQLNVTIDHPYKLCDFRPAYGFIFSDIIKEYDFYGHADIDVIFGNIRSFITDEVLNNFDIISVRPEYITGFFALYRNRSDISTLFKKSNDYGKIFQNNKYYGFDECGLICSQLTEGASLFEIPTEIESMTHVAVKLGTAGIINSYFNFHVVESVPGNLEWQKGKLIYKNEYEILLYHLISFKAHPLLKIPKWKTIPDKFYINESCFSKLKKI